jgi:SRSO17 transposase
MAVPLPLPTDYWQLVEYKRVPKSVTVWAAQASANVSGGANPGQDDLLPYTVAFKPDGSATASTIYLIDSTGSQHKHRVVVYHVTGSSYAREAW